MCNTMINNIKRQIHEKNADKKMCPRCTRVDLVTSIQGELSRMMLTSL